MPWDRVYLETGPGIAAGHRAAAVDVTGEDLVVRWNGRNHTHIPLERITWVGVEEDPYEAPFYRPTFVTVHCEEDDGTPAALTLTCWQSPHALVAAILRAREEKLARSDRLAASVN